MAFNPFDAFRKNSKPLMAALTIFVMIVFVLSTGGGGSDFFDWFARLLGGVDRRGPVLGSIEGDDYHTTDLVAIRQRREAANAYMLQATAQGDMKMQQQIAEDFEKKVIKDANRAEMANSIWRTRNQFMQFMMNQGAFLPRSFLAQFEQEFFQAYNRLRFLAAQTNERDSPGEAHLYRFMSRVMEHDFLRINQADRGMYFGRLPNKTDQDALQFALFLRLADKMGVKYVDEDINKQILGETEVALGEDTKREIMGLARRAAGDRALSSEKIFAAIGDEFRVLTLLKVLEGSQYAEGFNYPAAMTPYEFYQYYRDRCRELTFDVVDIPVESFLPLVTEEPGKVELDRYFRKYNQQEYDPARDTPGFKEPRRVKLEFVGVDASKPMYRATIPALQAASTIAGGFTAAYLGVGPIPGALEVAAPLLAEPLLVREDKKLAEQEATASFTQRFHAMFHGGGAPAPAAAVLSRFADVLQETPFFNVMGIRLAALDAAQRLPVSGQLRAPVRDSSAYHPLPLAALAGFLSVPMNPIVSLGQAGAAYDGMAELIEMRDRVVYGMQAAGALGPLTNPLVVAGPALANLPPLPAGVYASRNVARRIEDRPRNIARKDLESLEKKLNDLRKDLIPEEAKPDDGSRKPPPKPDPTKVKTANEEARDYISNWIRSHPSAETGKTAVALDRYHLGDDIVLKPVFEEMKGRSDFEREIASLFFNPRETNYEANRYKPIPLPVAQDFAKPVYVVWKDEDQEAKVYPQWDKLPAAMQEEVKKAWKLEKARALAQRAADDFAKAVGELAKTTLRDANNPAAFENGFHDLANAKKFAMFPNAINVAKLKLERSFQRESERASEFYAPPTITNKSILHPEPGMAEQLVALGDKPLGDVLVVPNRPKNHYYVLVLSQKDDLNVDSFYERVFRKTNVPSNERLVNADSLYMRHARDEAKREFDKDVLERLKAEMKYKETAELKEQKNKSQDTGEP